ncbi:hypothetical protein [Streptomyces sp. NPDC053048]|uniref:hypothetical protein n=1 Tax=Streptomyces sp. NPDC053048 TaxID=3365694 RepID=UPI0037CFC1C8
MPYKDQDKQRAYQRAWAVKKRAGNRAAYLAGKSCAVCGSTESLEIDHITPADKVSHNIWTWSPVRRFAELAKCQVLCRICHDRKCLSEGNNRVLTHGTRSRYEKGCRCSPCRRANAEHARRVRANRRARVQTALELDAIGRAAMEGRAR